MTDTRPVRDPLDLPATPARLRAAAVAAGAPPPLVRRALIIAGASPSPRDWTRFLGHSLLLLGAGLLLSGIVCFFAFNWDNLGRFAKFGLLEAGIVVCALLAWWRPREASGRIALASAAVLVGPLLGVFGQTYQTGADPWGLFAVWALLIAPWVVVSQFTALWLIEVLLCDVALALYWDQVLVHAGTYATMFMLLAAVQAIAVIAWEVQRRRVQPWLDQSWAPRLLVFATFTLLLIPSVDYIVDGLGFLARRDSEKQVALVALGIAVAVTMLVYRRVREDAFMLTVAGGSVLVILTVALGRFVFDTLKLEMGGALFMALFVIAEVTLAVAWLRRQVRGEAVE